MNKGYLVGGLAIVGAIALFAYLRPKPRRNSEGFFGASGMSGGMGSSSKVRSYCRKCKDVDTGYTYQNWNGICDAGDTCLQKR
jgi:hypothetical protein